MNIGNSQRLEYIDAMRGFTMILVVYSHILYMSLGVQNFATTLSFNSLFIFLRMPLFFFVSGFVLYKATQMWNLKNSFTFILKKFKVQIISTSIFFVLFCYIFNKSILDGVLDVTKYGYWFTIALFFFFILFIITDFLIKKFKCKDFVEIFIWLSSGIVIRSLSSKATIEDLGIPNDVASVLGLVYFKYYIFFILGIIVKRILPYFFKLINNAFATALIIAFFFIITIAYIKSDIQITVIWDDILKVLIGFTGIITVFAFFYKYQDCFTKDKRIGRTLQYIGRRTLDIYLLHYLFLPYNIQFLGDWFKANQNLSLEFFVSIALASMVIALCLVTSSIIRISPILANWLFGVKTPIRN
ncbi:MAG: acyltransferase [Bacteroidales bacterium]|nr:acyltransferase [Bacteroidales bacterium]